MFAVQSKTNADLSQSALAAQMLAAQMLAAQMLVALMLAAAVGCHALPKKEAAPPPPVAEKESKPLLPWRSDEPKVGVPSQIVATWTDTVLQESGVGAKRGFGGRLYFYGGGNDSKPIPVEGQLVVYAFDETNRKPTDNRPTKRFVFPPEQFALHRSKSELGVSYSFWLPWGDAANGAAKDVSLIARFEPVRGGQLVVSEQAAVRLPGRFDGPRVVPERAVATRIQPVQRVSHESRDAGPTAANVQHVSSETPTGSATIDTVTIPLPKGSRVHQAVTGVKGPTPVRTTVTYPGRGGAARLPHREP